MSETVENQEAQEAADDVIALAAEQKRSELEILKASLDEANAKAADYYDQLLRLKAEFENFQKRAEKNRSDARKWGKEEIVMRLVSLMDVMEQAEKAAHGTSDMKSVVMGLDMLYSEFKRLLKDEGLEEVCVSEGDKFDHAVQEAVETVEDEGEEDRVLCVMQKGYRFQGGLLRPARVKVSKKSS